MAKNYVKRPIYDGNACMLYDFMVSQGMTEEMIAECMGLLEEHRKRWGDESINRAPWQPIARWIQDPYSIPRHYIPVLCKVLNAPIEALFAQSRILNNKPFSVYGHLVRVEKQKIEEISSDDLITELKRRGFKIYKEA